LHRCARAQASGYFFPGFAKRGVGPGRARAVGPLSLRQPAWLSVPPPWECLPSRLVRVPICPTAVASPPDTRRLRPPHVDRVSAPRPAVMPAPRVASRRAWGLECTVEEPGWRGHLGSSMCTPGRACMHTHAPLVSSGARRRRLRLEGAFFGGPAKAPLRGCCTCSQKSSPCDHSVGPAPYHPLWGVGGGPPPAQHFIHFLLLPSAHRPSTQPCDAAAGGAELRSARPQALRWACAPSRRASVDPLFRVLAWQASKLPGLIHARVTICAVPSVPRPGAHDAAHVSVISAAVAAVAQRWAAWKLMCEAVQH
jgi:hypothetical protein